MGILGRIKNSINNFYGGGEEDDDYGVEQDEDFGDQGKDDSGEDDSGKKDDDGGYGDDKDNPSGFGEDEDLNNPEKDDQDPNNGDDSEEQLAEKNKDGEKEGKEDKNDDKKDEPEQSAKASRLQAAIMKKEAIIHGCSPRVEQIPCPICHKRSVYKSLRVFDWFPLLLGARIGGVNLYRYYCFNKKCSKSWYKNYVFNCPSPKFTPASAPTKRQFNAS